MRFLKENVHIIVRIIQRLKSNDLKAKEEDQKKATDSNGANPMWSHTIRKRTSIEWGAIRCKGKNTE